MTEELAEKLSPPTPADTVQPTPSQPLSESASNIANEGSGDVRERVRILESIAEVAYNQRQYHIASKKYTEARNRPAAMKCLLKSGDTKRIVYFAQTSKQKEIYLMAANYLQTQDWRKDPEVMRHICMFYQRGKAPELLSSFYEACAQVEIDEYRNYPSAIQALQNARDTLESIATRNDTQKQKIIILKENISFIQQYVTAKENCDAGNYEMALQQLQSIAQERNINEIVRLGDIYSCLINIFILSKQYRNAYDCLEEMKERLRGRSNVSFYVSAETVQIITEGLKS